MDEIKKEQVTTEKEEVKKAQSTSKKKEGMSEKEYIAIYERLSVLELKRVNSPQQFKKSEADEFAQLINKAKEYKKGKLAVKRQTLCVDTVKMFLSFEFKLPQKYVDLIVNKKNVDEKQYLQM